MTAQTRIDWCIYDTIAILNRVYDKLANEWSVHLNGKTTTHRECADCEDYTKAAMKLLRAMDNVNVE